MSKKKKSSIETNQLHLDESNAAAVNDLSSTICTTTTTSDNDHIAASIIKNTNSYRSVSQLLSTSGNNRFALQSINNQRDLSSNTGSSITQQNFDSNVPVASA